MNKHEPKTDPLRFQQASDWLIRLQEDDATDDEIVRWIDWCEEHEGNRKAFEHLLPLWQAFDDHEQSLPGDMAGASVLPYIRRDILPFDAQGKGSTRPRKVKASWAIAASLVLALAATFFVVRRDAVPTLDPVATLASKPGHIQPAILPDGSKLDLGARSAIAINFTGRERQIEMEDGEAYFSVKPDKQKPFVVRAGTISVTAIGTAFNVQKTGERVVVTVTEGTVKVDESASHPLMAPAGYQVIYDTTLSKKPTMRAIDSTAATSWRQGHLEYNAEPLSSVVATLNRYTEQAITIEDPTLARLNYTGTIEVDSMKEWIEALPRIFPVEIQQGEEDKLRIARRQ